MSNAPFEAAHSRPIRPRRSVLFVPAANARAMEKALTLPADALIFDLEDSVAPEAKDGARERLRAFLKEHANGIDKEVVIRINGLDTAWGTEDLLAARAAGCDAILLPKVETKEDVRTAAFALGETDAPPSLRLWAMVETPRAILNAGDIGVAAGAKNSRLDCLVCGPNDLAKATGIAAAPGRPHLHPFLMQVVLAARAGGLDVLDGVYNDFRDAEGFAAECRQGRAMGFDGKTLIHPGQIEAANAAFSVDDNAVAEAEKILAAFDEPENRGKGVITINGRMVERLHRDEAAALIAKARAISKNEDRPV
jgi:citrate lyase subunit beta/citryl-CoA lyase